MNCYFIASTLQQIDCPVLHLTGETYMFSLYEVGDFVSFSTFIYLFLFIDY